MDGQASWIPYCGAAPVPAEWLGRWNWDPLLIGCLAIGIFLWGRWTAAAKPLERQRLGLAAVLLALLFISPLCALTSALFSARVTHHVLLTAAVAPLLMLSIPRASFPKTGSLTLWTFVQAAVFWAWHSPNLYSAALSNDAVYWLMQASLLASAFGFWVALRRSNEAAAITGLLLSMVQMGLLGALITFAGTPLYAPHFSSTAAWSLSPLEDQQLAGLIMWIPSAGIYLGAALALANRWLRADFRPSS